MSSHPSWGRNLVRSNGHISFFSIVGTRSSALISTTGGGLGFSPAALTTPTVRSIRLDHAGGVQWSEMQVALIRAVRSLLRVSSLMPGSIGACLACGGPLRASGRSQRGYTESTSMIFDTRRPLPWRAIMWAIWTATIPPKDQPSWPSQQTLPFTME